MNIQAIIPAGGTSSRYKGGNKLLENLDGKPVLMHSIDKMNEIDCISKIIIPSSEGLIPTLKKLTENYKKVEIVKGGSCRQESVFNGLKASKDCDYVLIHDGARPLIKKETIQKALNETFEKKAIIVAVKTIDTIKKVDSNLKIIETPNRAFLWNVQTPQIFDFKLIFEAHKKLEGHKFSDDGGLLEHLGADVYIFEGEYSNFKITTKEDLLKAEKLIECNK
ncbi:MAG: 2-C-methyl-D-erythritol 4-phosphate cytidylyltransferase [Candidatus Gastranaerophilales bacterium]|nr:2-C-methyl-D-erythritol 4-phosphate cytidylyltransferase [Candidatus Gastranaerophilales bacterium]